MAWTLVWTFFQSREREQPIRNVFKKDWRRGWRSLSFLKEMSMYALNYSDKDSTVLDDEQDPLWESLQDLNVKDVYQEQVGHVVLQIRS